MAKRSERKELAKHAAREMSVVKRDDMIQHSRFTLTVQAQKCILYAISRIKPEDTAFTEYVFDIKDFYDLCGIEKDSYTVLKQTLKSLRDRSWWVVIDDKGTESAVSWFTTVRTNKSSGKVTVKFHEDMMPYLLQLATQARDQGSFYTQFGLKYILPMKGQYSPRLYEILKSYQKNNREWFFEINHLKHLLDCENYVRWPDFRRRALEPAIEEINTYSDLNVAYDVEKDGNKVVRVAFYMAKKNKALLAKTNTEIYHNLDGQISFGDIIKNFDESVKAKFMRENPIEPEEDEDPLI